MKTLFRATESPPPRGCHLAGLVPPGTPGSCAPRPAVQDYPGGRSGQDEGWGGGKRERSGAARNIQQETPNPNPKNLSPCALFPNQMHRAAFFGALGPPSRVLGTERADAPPPTICPSGGGGTALLLALILPLPCPPLHSNRFSNTGDLRTLGPAPHFVANARSLLAPDRVRQAVLAILAWAPVASMA